MTELRDKVGCTSLQINGHTFHSHLELGSFLTTESVPRDGFVAFPDAIALLAVAHTAGVTMDTDVLSYQDKMKKVGYAHMEESKVTNSFFMNLPAHFGTTPKMGASARDT